MTLIKLILAIFSTRWHEKIFVGAYQEYRRFSSFINEVFQKMYIITEIQHTYGNNVRFALWSHNSSTYIATLVAMILKNVDFYLIPPKMSVTNIIAIIANSDINILFTSLNVSEFRVSTILANVPCYKLSYNIDTNGINYTKNTDLQSKLDINLIQQMILVINNSTYNAADIEDIVINDFKLSRREREIGIFSSSADSLYPKCMYFRDEEVVKAILTLADSDLLPELQSKKIYSEVDFANVPVWTMLWPLYSGATFAFHMDEANVVITDSSNFERAWTQTTKHVYDIRVIGKLLFKNWLDWLFRIITRRKLKTYFNSDVKKEAIIILNATLSPRIMKTIVGYLPLYTTYGMQETNQIVAVNNYSSFEHTKNNCVGEPLHSINVSLREGLLNKGEGSLVIATELFSKWVDLEKGMYYDTQDHGSLETYKGKTLIFVYGKLKYAIKDDPHIGSNYENIERILKSIPYIKEVLIYNYNEELYILVSPNTDIIQITNLDLIDFKNLIKSYKTYINNVYGFDFVKDVKLVYEDFAKTHTSKIKKAFYILAKDIEESL